MMALTLLGFVLVLLYCALVVAFVVSGRRG